VDEGHSGFAIVMTSLTTAAGMWSFAFSDVAPVADLGIFASASIIIGFKPNKWMMGKLHLRGKKDRNNNYNITEKIAHLAINNSHPP
jgi:predicted RND superfamily exporter protein